jgi:Na+/H+-translocating membrane pyrophosphatase
MHKIYSVIYTITSSQWSIQLPGEYLVEGLAIGAELVYLFASSKIENLSEKTLPDPTRHSLIKITITA